ncbi:DUF3566 domain-containing protein [Amycolatopsis taiwanensis]|uniref:DUF3566 domain-containing protein n=1 Tax=Amycolatopsis taiwanensis TaxID=342230 RepID=A0A9W6R0X5_9PSEU|nr:DUF3566 domain-containing protein [Amycolatopsis taiwanensis]GLY67549.1 hypothetical protein Atai01_41680 [Amycolatopsis taiwanensis]
MTSPEDPERPGTGKADPPWQRLSKDSAATSTTETASEAWPPDERAENVLYSEKSAGKPAVTESAAHGLFGNQAESAPTEVMSGLRGLGKVSVPTAGAKGRATPSALRRPGRGPRRASLQVKRIDPWSVLKLSLVLGAAMFFIWLVAVGVLYTVLDGMGVWDKLNGTFSSLVSGEGGNAPSGPLISAGRVFGIAAVIGAINIVLLSALATVSAFIYNVSADLAGGLEVTLSERD